MQKIEPKKLIIGLLAAAALLGALLGKAAPMEAGFSSLFKKEVPVEKKKTEESTQETQEVQPLSYVEQINQEIQQDKFAGRIKVPLILQTDERWKATPYGTGENNTLEKNGCAIVSLAMISSYLDGGDVQPQAILDWSQSNYFIEGQGTNWTIFYDFAVAKGYMYEELSDMSMVENHLSQGHPVLISVQPGKFTETGHIMVLTGVSDGKFWLNDPNDSETKGHSRTQYTAEELGNEALNYWAIYK
ncbi:C39 family peptidase [Enterococcus sp. LJL128]|uniref:C39 family peptidase n=1 Tax=Enterococcus sp. LJL51 TaxID=3416656 RepID=UPI003CF162B0